MVKELDIARQIKEILENKRFYERLGQLARNIIYRRVKNGFGVDDDSSETPRRIKLAELSPRYVNKRKNVSLGEFGAPKRSNLTFTGEMLNSMLVKAVKGGFSIRMNRKVRPDGHTNEEIAFFSSLDRPWFALTGGEQRIILQEIRFYLQRELRRI